jgi:hypothetical protein
LVIKFCTTYTMDSFFLLYLLGGQRLLSRFSYLASRCFSLSEEPVVPKVLDPRL